MQHMEIMISQLLGSISITLYADWDAKLPANLKDNDIHPGIETLPFNRCGLTSMSPFGGITRCTQNQCLP